MNGVKLMSVLLVVPALGQAGASHARDGMRIERSTAAADAVHLVATKPPAKARCVWQIDGRWKILRPNRSPLLLDIRIDRYGPEPEAYWFKGKVRQVSDGRIGQVHGNGTDRVFFFKYTWSPDQNPITHTADSYEGVIGREGSVSGTARIDQQRGASWSQSSGLQVDPVPNETWRREGNLVCKPEASVVKAKVANDPGFAGAASQPSRVNPTVQPPPISR